MRVHGDGLSILRNWLGCKDAACDDAAALAGLERLATEVPDEDSLDLADRPLLDETCRRLAGPSGLSPLPFWPGNAPFAVCFSFDLDRTRRPFYRRVGDALAGRYPFFHAGDPFDNWHTLGDFIATLNGQATLFLLDQRPRLIDFCRGPQHIWGAYDLYAPELLRRIRKLVNLNVEVGVHGALRPDSVERFRTERKALEAALGVTIGGVRQHYLRHRGAATFALQEAAGYGYDSSIGGNLRNGFRLKTAFPVRIPGLNLIELPVTFMDSAALVEMKATGRTPAEQLAELLDRIASASGLLVMNFHPHLLNAAYQPPLVEAALMAYDQAKRRGAWIARLGEVHDWWRKRLS